MSIKPDPIPAKIEASVLTSLFSSADKRSVLFKPELPAVPWLSKS